MPLIVICSTEPQPDKLSMKQSKNTYLGIRIYPRQDIFRHWVEYRINPVYIIQ